MERVIPILSNRLSFWYSYKETQNDKTDVSLSFYYSSKNLEHVTWVKARQRVNIDQVNDLRSSSS